MKDLIKRFLNKSPNEILDKNQENDSHDIRIATCALLLEMANIDDEFSSSEKERIILILKENFGLSENLATALIKKTKEELKGSIDLWQFTNLINQHYSIEEKKQIIEMIWKIAFADGKLDKHEDYLVHKLANLLRLTHKQLIDAKLKVLHGNKKPNPQQK